LVFFSLELGGATELDVLFTGVGIPVLPEKFGVVEDDRIEVFEGITVPNALATSSLFRFVAVIFERFSCTLFGTLDLSFILLGTLDLL
jgi:hypothetical protein